ncbi:kelch repeat protein, partial [Ostertagia ostertagi]
FDPATNQWSDDVAPTIQTHYSCGVAVLDGSIYVVGGTSTVDCMSAVERYDVRRNEWFFVGHMRESRAGVAVAVLDGCLYALGGHDEGLQWNTVE